MINLEQLKYALTLATLGNFTRAANELHISQPTLSRNIQILEEKIGIEIFIRSKSRIITTHAGTKFLQQAEAILHEVRKLESQAALERGVLTGEIVIATGTYPEELFLSKILARISLELPEITIKILNCSPIEFISEAYSQSIDLFIGDKSFIEKDRNFKNIPLKLQKEGYFFCNSTHPLLEKETIHFTDIFKYPFVGSHLPGRLTKNFPKSSNFGYLIGTVLCPRICCYSFTLQKKIVATSNCLGLGAKSSLAAEIANETLAILPLNIPAMRSNFGLSYLKSRELSPLDKAVIDIILDNYKN